ncbi:MAG: aminotransferase class III-fold pyridoxal phosphate-dependent enzyme [Candidatus Woesearchaeota archaeon]
MDRDKLEIILKTEMPGPNARALSARYDKAFAKGTYAYDSVESGDGTSIGPWVHDVDGNWLLDFAGQVGVNVLGYNNPEILEKLRPLPLQTPQGHAGTDFIRGDATVKVAEKILELSSQFGFDKTFFLTSGTKAVSAAKKAAQDNRRGANIGISFKGGFHGRTLDSLSSTTSKRVQGKWYDQPGREIYIDYCVEEPCRCGFMRWDKHNRKMMSELEQFLNPSTGFIDPKQVKYILLEPIQGEGGYWVPSKSFMQEVERCAREYGIPLIVDEVQSGMGRTGKWWAIEHFGVSPDLLVFGKGFQLNGIIGKEPSMYSERGRESETCGNGGISLYKVLESLYYIEHIEKHNLLENASKMGEYFNGRLNHICTYSSDLLEEARGIGLMQALEFRSKAQRDEFEERCFKKGLMTMGCGYKSMRFLPPLDVTKREIDEAMRVMFEVRRDMLYCRK